MKLNLFSSGLIVVFFHFVLKICMEIVSDALRSFNFN